MTSTKILAAASGAAIANLLVSLAAFGQTFAPKEAGVAGDLFIGGIYLAGESNLSANDDADPLLPGYDATGNSTSRALPGIIGNITYTFASKSHQLYAGVSRSNAAQGRFAGELGYRHFLTDGSAIEVGYIPSLLPEKIWADPYLLNQPRSETRQQLHAVRTKYERIKGTGLGVELGYGVLDVKREESGAGLSEDARALLVRDGHYGYLGVEFLYPFARTTFVTPAIYMFDRDAEGKANSFNAYGVEMRFFHRANRHTFVANIGYEQYHYDAAHPIFDRTRNDTRLKLFGSYLFAKPFGWESASFTLIASMNDRDSEIDFFDESGLFAGAGLTYAF